MNINPRFSFLRKTVLLCLSFLFIYSSQVYAQADLASIPKITIVVGFPPGGGVDIVGRLVAEKLSIMLNKPVIVENKPGASSGIATKYVASAKPDGQTIFVNSNSMLVNQLMNPDSGYDVNRDLAPIGKFFSQANILVANNDLPANNLSELIALAKKQDITFSSPGIGSIPHLAAERLLTVNSNIKVRHIPYPGASPALASAIGGQVQLASVSAPTAVNFIKGGKLKGLVVTSAQRVSSLPNVPTAIELGYKGFAVETWGGFFAPVATPKSIIYALENAITKIMTEPEMKEKLINLGFELVIVKPDTFQQEINEELKTWKDLLGKIKLNDN